MLDRLRSIKATFTEDTFYHLWEYHGDTTTFAAIATYGDSAVRRLVDLLDDSLPSDATIDGRPVPTGVMYNQALKRIAYFEWDCSSNTEQVLCAGSIDPNATAAELRAARRAWQEALRRRIVTYTK